MANMIDANDAKNILGCDDATLQNYINSGALRAQKSNGVLVVNQEDVMALANESDDGDIILSGDSEDLSIDLGEVVDDGGATLAEGGETNAGITMSDEEGLEVVNFAEEEANLDLEDDSAMTQDLSFTDSNTAMMTDIDETIVDDDASAVTSDFESVDYDDDDEDDSGEYSGSQRTIRSQRADTGIKATPVGIVGPIFAILTLVVLLFFLVPFIILMQTPIEGQRDPFGGPVRGVADGFYYDLASNFAGYSIEPNKAKHEEFSTNPHQKRSGQSAMPADSYLDGKTIENRVLASVIHKVEIAQEPQEGGINTLQRDESGNLIPTLVYAEGAPDGRPPEKKTTTITPSNNEGPIEIITYE